MSFDGHIDRHIDGHIDGHKALNCRQASPKNLESAEDMLHDSQSVDVWLYLHMQICLPHCMMRSGSEPCLG